MTIKGPILKDVKKLEHQGYYWIRLEGSDTFTIGQLYIQTYEEGQTYVDLNGIKKPCKSWWEFNICGSEIGMGGVFGKIAEIDPIKIIRS